MKASRGPVAGESRTCPHCKAIILKSAVSCPLCQHVLRFGSAGADPRSSPTTCPLTLEATVVHPGNGNALEYSVLMEVHDESGKLISRHAVGIGAINRTEKRTFSVRVEMSSPIGSV
jgi:hypothetical protein